MPRESQSLPLPEGIPDDLVEIAGRPHALNALVPEFDFQRASEAATIESRNADRKLTVSDILRKALVNYFDTHPDSEFIHNEALIALRFSRDQETRRAVAKKLHSQ